MPSDAKKKQQQKKKEAAKARQTGKKPVGNASRAEDGKDEGQQPGENGTSNGTLPLSAEGLLQTMFLSLDLMRRRSETAAINICMLKCAY